MRKVRNILEVKGRQIYSVPTDASVFSALKLMVDKNIGALVVLENDRLAGLFTERDYAQKIALRGKSSRETTISEIMNKNVETVNPDDSIEHCMNLMTNKYVRHLPVVEDSKVTGIVSIGDVVKYVIEDQQYIIEHLENYISGSK